MEITRGVHRIRLDLVNVYLLVDEEGLVLVDTGTPDSVDRIISYVAGLGHSPEELRAILITHGDLDHVGGLRKLQELSGAATYGPAAEIQAIRAGKMPPAAPSRTLKKKRFLMRLTRLVGWFRPGRIEHPVQDGDRLPFFGGLEVLATPGHTAGHVSYFQPERKILFAGDSVNTRNGRPATSPANLTRDQGEMLASVKKQAALQPELLCPGHGRPITEAGARLKVLIGDW